MKPPPSPQYRPRAAGNQTTEGAETGSAGHGRRLEIFASHIYRPLDRNSSEAGRIASIESEGKFFKLPSASREAGFRAFRGKILDVRSVQSVYHSSILNIRTFRTFEIRHGDRPLRSKRIPRRRDFGVGPVPNHRLAVRVCPLETSALPRA